MPATSTDREIKKARKVIKSADKLMGRKTPKKAFKTTGIIMDARDLETLRSVAHLRVIRGEADRASVSDLVREAVAEYIERHQLHAQQYAADNAGRLGAPV